METVTRLEQREDNPGNIIIIKGNFTDKESPAGRANKNAEGACSPKRDEGWNDGVAWTAASWLGNDASIRGPMIAG